MDNKKNNLILLTACILLIIGFIMFILCYSTTRMVAPGSRSPPTVPVFLVLLIFLFIFSGILLFLWNIKSKITKKTKLLATVIILFFSIISFHYIYTEYCVITEYPSFEFLPDKTNKTITLTEFNHGDFTNQLYWDDVVVTMGNATLPIGLINKGDVITNCSGIIKLYVYMPGHTGASFLYSYGFT